MKRYGILAIIAIGFGFTTQVKAAEQDRLERKATFNLIAPSSQGLTIKEASDLVFNDAIISSDNIITTTTSDTNISVEDIRGEAQGWSLHVKLSPFQSTTDATRQLVGANLFYPNVSLTTTNVGNTVGTEPLGIGTDTGFLGSETGTVVDTNNQLVPLIAAKQGTGYGLWTATYSSTTGKVQLKVPAGNLASTYESTVTYSLNDTPPSN